MGDDGPGIAPDKREQIFESEYSATGKGTRGLLIADMIAQSPEWTLSGAGSTLGSARIEVIGIVASTC